MKTSRKIGLDAQQIFYELNEFSQHQELRARVLACVEAQKAASAAILARQFQPQPHARHDVSPEALQAILAAGTMINGIRTERHISNVVVFNDARYAEAIMDTALASRRAALDRVVSRMLAEVFERGSRLQVQSSGFFLYPAGGYMGWHTNAQNPGWRMYVSFAEAPGRSFFRYRDPDSGEIVTSMDGDLNVRLFRVTTDRLLWHAIYSDTNRFSFGYKVLQPRLRDTARRVVHRVTQLVR